MIIPLMCGLGLVSLLVMLTPILHYKHEVLEVLPTNSLEQLSEAKEKILKQYLRDEASFVGQHLSAAEWNKRKAFLENYYIDCVKRMDALRRTNA